MLHDIKSYKRKTYWNGMGFLPKNIHNYGV